MNKATRCLDTNASARSRRAAKMVHAEATAGWKSTEGVSVSVPANVSPAGAPRKCHTIRPPSAHGTTPSRRQRALMCRPAFAFASGMVQDRAQPVPPSMQKRASPRGGWRVSPEFQVRVMVHVTVNTIEEVLPSSRDVACTTNQYLCERIFCSRFDDF